jgi:hypothetical protein
LCLQRGTELFQVIVSLRVRSTVHCRSHTRSQLLPSTNRPPETPVTETEVWYIKYGCSNPKLKTVKITC